uniref:Uncharacterized protein n=1 Tax=Oryza rufipogon TaxID=4529 RepID=A0A0E0RE97_ORYRU
MAATRRSLTLSGGRSGVSLLPVLCVGAVGVWMVLRSLAIVVDELIMIIGVDDDDTRRCRHGA